MAWVPVKQRGGTRHNEAPSKENNEKKESRESKRIQENPRETKRNQGKPRESKRIQEKQVKQGY
jgi:hypothetical protein